MHDRHLPQPCSSMFQPPSVKDRMSQVPHGITHPGHCHYHTWEKATPSSSPSSSTPLPGLFLSVCPLASGLVWQQGLVTHSLYGKVLLGREGTTFKARNPELGYLKNPPTIVAMVFLLPCTLNIPRETFPHLLGKRKTVTHDRVFYRK